MCPFLWKKWSWGWASLQPVLWSKMSEKMILWCIFYVILHASRGDQIRYRVSWNPAKLVIRDPWDFSDHHHCCWSVKLMIFDGFRKFILLFIELYRAEFSNVLGKPCSRACLRVGKTAKRYCCRYNWEMFMPASVFGVGHFGLAKCLYLLMSKVCIVVTHGWLARVNPTV